MMLNILYYDHLHYLVLIRRKFFLYWIMTQRNLNNLKKSAAYKDYMMLHDWSFI